MKLFVIFVVLAIGACQARHVLEKRSEPSHARKGVMRSGFLKNSKDIIIAACKANGLTKDAETKLDKEFDESEVCVSKKPIFSVPQEEFIQNMNDCNKELLTLIRNCLKENEKFYPDYMLQLRNSFTTFLYAGKDVLESNEFKACAQKMEEPAATKTMDTCVERAAQESHASAGLPQSKSEACETMDKISQCYSKVIGQYCESNDNVNKFLQLNVAAITSPCKTNV
ncbi:uncharacterized protein LOC130448459 [Diorhabda sublineata]|uniref:uncharacterized protein LOC130448459 n=1 Tax=Diorhabda sublineata TaxID=1163346 RepID=UPI0024E0DCB9|nr:uncharacterized protein LOC130448459 [Diorhabda sublineata]